MNDKELFGLYKKEYFKYIEDYMKNNPGLMNQLKYLDEHPEESKRLLDKFNKTDINDFIKELWESKNLKNKKSL